MRSFALKVFAIVAATMIPSLHAQTTRPDSSNLPVVSEVPSFSEPPSVSEVPAPAVPGTPAIQSHRFWDRTNILLFSGVAASRALDYASTKNMLARGRQEILIPDDIVYSQAGFPALEAAATGASVGVSYLLHRTGHHSLERWLSIGHMGVTDFGAVRNYCLKSRHR